jgi:uncharacterized protein YndB with AHSA1/START domain/DNA-binding transcriptional ArsR family regulator
MNEDAVFRALADASRRQLLDRLHQKNGRTLGDLCEGLDMTRQAVAKHLTILDEANLVSWKRHGREKLHFINLVPISEIAERWIRKFERRHRAALSALKNKLEGEAVTNARKSSFVYVTYIRATTERLWSALTSQEFAQQYCRGAYPNADWKIGGSWELILPDGRVCDAGEIVTFEPFKRLGIRWRNEFKPELKAEGWSLCTMEIESVGDAVKLTVIHSIEREGSKFIDAVSSGWPQVLSNLKSLLETGSVVLGPKYFSK